MGLFLAQFNKNEITWLDRFERNFNTILFGAYNTIHKVSVAIRRTGKCSTFGFYWVDHFVDVHVFSSKHGFPVYIYTYKVGRSWLRRIAGH